MGTDKLKEQENQLLHTLTHKTPTQEELDDFLVEVLAATVRNIRKKQKKQN